jgi:hypothetical protein
MGRPRVLYVEGHAPSSRYLKDALTTEGLVVELADPNALPQSPADFGVYDAVILSDVDAMQISPPQMEAISTYVRDLGGDSSLPVATTSTGSPGIPRQRSRNCCPSPLKSKSLFNP